jgi:hypothetical protein
VPEKYEGKSTAFERSALSLPRCPVTEPASGDLLAILQLAGSQVSELLLGIRHGLRRGRRLLRPSDRKGRERDQERENEPEGMFSHDKKSTLREAVGACPRPSSYSAARLKSIQMADTLYLSLWYPNLRLEALPDKLTAVLGAFAAHGGEAKVYAATVWPVSWNEAPMFQRVWADGAEAEPGRSRARIRVLAVEEATELLHDDYAYEFQIGWNLWELESGGAERWKNCGFDSGAARTTLRMTSGTSVGCGSRGWCG